MKARATQASLEATSFTVAGSGKGNPKGSAISERRFGSRLLVQLSGCFSYEQMVDFSFRLARKWNVRSEELILDFTGFACTDEEGVRFVIANLAHSVNRGGKLGLVRLPASAKQSLDRIWSSENVRRFSSARQAVQFFHLRETPGGEGAMKPQAELPWQPCPGNKT